jgi:hypothetical protein
MKIGGQTVRGQTFPPVLIRIINGLHEELSAIGMFVSGYFDFKVSRYLGLRFRGFEVSRSRFLRKLSFQVSKVFEVSKIPRKGFKGVKVLRFNVFKV